VSLFRRGKDSVDVPPLSKRDYAHTTGHSPDSTSLIPAIKEAPNGNHAGEPTEAIAPVPAPPMPEPPPVQTTGLRLVRVEPYSVTRLAFVVSVLLMIVMTVAVAVFWMALSMTGVWSEINQNVAALLSDDSASFDIRDYLGFTRMVGGTLIVSGINVILMTALATVGARLFNLAAALLGGIEATFTDD
jgi:hypothetical protein